MKKQILMMALCVSTLMPVTVFGEEAAVQNVSTVNKEETASGDENPKIEESEVTAVNDTVTVAIDADILDYPGKKEGNIIGEVLEGYFYEKDCFNNKHTCNNDVIMCNIICK